MQMNATTKKILSSFRSSRRLLSPSCSMLALPLTRPNFENKHKEERSWSQVIPILAIVSLFGTLNLVECEEEKEYRRAEVEKHTTKETGIWVTYKDGVYDITKFVPNHPGGVDKITLAAGKDVEAFWNIYRQHYNSALPQQLLLEMRIGKLHADDVVQISEKENDENNPYRNDPVLSPVLRFQQKQPLNAEPPMSLLLDNWLTPNDLWFVRNHHPVPRLSQEELDKFRLEIVLAPDLSSSSSSESSALLSLSLEDLKKRYPQVSVVSTLQCGGNRRSSMSALERTNGASWDAAAISTAKWTGVRLRDLLGDLGVSEESLFAENENNNDSDQRNIQHVHFLGLDDMEASIPVRKAVSRFGDVILAYAMNDEPVPPEHGFPLRAVVPGHVGVRNVKWLKKIRLSGEEAQGPWQRGMAYKGFGPSVRSLEGIDIEKIPSLQEQTVQSAIAFPPPEMKIESGEPLTVKGYAYSGGGRGIVRVDVSIDGGKTWKTADLSQGNEQPLDRAWAWTFWECDFDLPESLEHKTVEIIAKATDASYNVQPDSIQGIWNLRGINNNAWHRVSVTIVPPVAGDEEDD